jgi:hypothetical protein
MLEWHGGILQMLWMEWLLAILLCTCALIGVYFGWQNEYSLSPSVQSLHEAVTFVARRFQAAIALMLGFYTMQSSTDGEKRVLLKEMPWEQSMI